MRVAIAVYTLALKRFARVIYPAIRASVFFFALALE